jgi:hypothetical protein
MQNFEIFYLPGMAGGNSRNDHLIPPVSGQHHMLQL